MADFFHFKNFYVNRSVFIVKGVEGKIVIEYA